MFPSTASATFRPSKLRSPLLSSGYSISVICRQSRALLYNLTRILLRSPRVSMGLRRFRCVEYSVAVAVCLPFTVVKLPRDIFVLLRDIFVQTDMVSFPQQSQLRSHSSWSCRFPPSTCIPSVLWPFVRATKLLWSGQFPTTTITAVSLKFIWQCPSINLHTLGVAIIGKCYRISMLNMV
jgi:hypothetical protein